MTKTVTSFPYEVDVHRAAAAACRGALELARGALDEALRSLRVAHGAFATIDMPYETARVRLQIAAALEAAGDDDTASLERAAATAILRDLGIPEAGNTAADDHGLSPRELEVLQLLATGRTNREIAAELVVSERTVDRHVSNIFTKLDVSTRTAAAAYAFEQRLT